MSREAAAPPSSSQNGATLVRILLFLAVVAFTVFVFSIRDEAAKLAAYGYPGVFLVAFLSSATVLLPAPGVAVVFALGSVLNPFLIGLSAGAGAALGELSGYAAGFSGQAVVKRSATYDRMTGWMRRYGSLTILLLAFLPNPFFDVAGMIAGALKMPLHRFFLWCLLGKTAKMLAFAYTGAYSINWLANG